MRQPLPPGTAVELIAPLATYGAGARGVVVGTSLGHATVLVRLDDTGHTLVLSRDSVRIAEPEAAD